MSELQRATALIKQYEGLFLAPYLCPAGIPTIGYGSTRYEDGTPVTLDDPEITEERAEKLLAHEANVMGIRVRSMAKGCTEGQYGALVSFAYNLGAGALKGSTLLRKHNAGDYEGASAEFPRWVNAGGRKLAGLVRRRAAERRMYEG